MKAFVCDSCDKIIHSPHSAKMKEFYFGFDSEKLGVFPKPSHRVVSIHLCDDCFHGLNVIGQKTTKKKGEIVCT